MSGDRTPFVGGNWKMNLTRQAAGELARAVASSAPAAIDAAVFPAFVHLETAAREANNASLILGAQDLYFEADGAFTGEVSAAMLADLGAAAVLTGHSERRHVIGETDELVGQKTAAAVAAGLTAVLCVGETLDQREAGETDAVNAQQLKAGLAALTSATDLATKIVIAYEPVWAIGTGKTASAADAQAAHAALRAELKALTNELTAERTRIIYGGSMKPANAAELMAQPDIDGGLVGGASLNPEDFLAICNAAAAAKAPAA